MGRSTRAESDHRRHNFRAIAAKTLSCGFLLLSPPSFSSPSLSFSFSFSFDSNLSFYPLAFCSRFPSLSRF
ncbi:hypothetical protein LXL04_029862 [Taraxacum kok-saghyz]